VFIKKAFYPRCSSLGAIMFSFFLGDQEVEGPVKKKFFEHAGQGSIFVQPIKDELSNEDHVWPPEMIKSEGEQVRDVVQQEPSAKPKPLVSAEIMQLPQNKYSEDLLFKKDSGFNRVRQLLSLDESRNRYWLMREAAGSGRIITDIPLEEDEVSEDPEQEPLVDFTRTQTEADMFVDAIRDREQRSRDMSIRDVLRVFHDACIATGVDSLDSFELVWRAVIMKRVNQLDHAQHSSAMYSLKKILVGKYVPRSELQKLGLK
jgi:hypothetical protein